jgi:hypothetical protein
VSTLPTKILVPRRLIYCGRSSWGWRVLLFELRKPALARMYIAQEIEVVIEEVYLALVENY